MSAEGGVRITNMKGSRSLQGSPDTSSTASNTSTTLPLTRQSSDPGVGVDSPSSEGAYHRSNSTSSHPGSGGRGHRLGTDPEDIVIVTHQDLMSQTDTETTIQVCTASSPSYSELPELVQSRSLILQHSHSPSDEGGINWLYDFYPSVLASSPKDKLNSFEEQQQQPPPPPTSQTPPPSLTKIQTSTSITVSGSPSSSSSSTSSSAPPPPGGHHHHPGNSSSHHQTFVHHHNQTNTVFRSQEKYVVTLGAPSSIAQRMGEDTLTYLNKGQFYTLEVRANTSIHASLPKQVKTVIALTFVDEPDKRAEFSHWQYWYSLQANPNQRAFDIDRKNCENVRGKPEDVAYNAASFVWCPEVGSRIVLRINCLSTEFSSQKGVKGYPLHVVADTYEDLEVDSIEPVHRAYCKVKVFRDKGAERKNKDETKSVERRMQKFMKQQPGAASLDSDLAPTAVFHPPSKETMLTSTSTFGPKPFLFVPQQLTRRGDGQHRTHGHGGGDVGGCPAKSLANLQDKPSAFVWHPQSFTKQSNSLPCYTQDNILPTDKSASTALLANIRERETKRTFSNSLAQAKEDLDHLEVDAPPKKSARLPTKPLTTLYVRKQEDKVYNALLLDSLTVDEFKLQISNKYDVPVEMIKNVFKKTKKGLLVNFDDAMIARFQDEDDLVFDLHFDNQKGCFDLIIRY